MPRRLPTPRVKFRAHLHTIFDVLTPPSQPTGPGTWEGFCNQPEGYSFWISHGLNYFVSEVEGVWNPLCPEVYKDTYISYGALTQRFISRTMPPGQPFDDRYRSAELWLHLPRDAMFRVVRTLLRRYEQTGGFPYRSADPEVYRDMRKVGRVLRALYQPPEDFWDVPHAQFIFLARLGRIDLDRYLGDGVVALRESGR